METCSLGLYDVMCLCRTGPLPGEEVPGFAGTQRGLQCCTLSGVISHKASLILHQEQLRGLWSEIRRCTIHFLRITSLIIHLNCSERLSRAKCQARCWLGMCRHVHVKGWARDNTTHRDGERGGSRLCVCVSFHWQPQGSVVWGQRRACNREAWCTQHEHPGQVCGEIPSTSCLLEVVNLE